MEPQLSCPPTACYAGPRAAGVMDPRSTKNRQAPRPSRNFHLGTTETSYVNSSASPVARGFPLVAGTDNVITPAATTASADTQPSLISHVCSSYTSVTAPATTLSLTGYLSHDTKASSRFCQGANSVRDHCFHPDLGGCSRHVSPRISGEQDRRLGGETAYGEGASSRGHSTATTSASCSSSDASMPFGNQLISTPSPGQSVALSTTSDGRG